MGSTSNGPVKKLMEKSKRIALRKRYGAQGRWSENRAPKERKYKPRDVRAPVGFLYAPHGSAKAKRREAYQGRMVG